MTSRERVLAAVRGGEVDRKPVAGFGDLPGTDLAILSSSDTLRPDEGRVQLVAVWNPFGQAERDGVAINDVLGADPKGGASILARYAERTRAEIAEALARGADGIWYRLAGASPEKSTPMQYGGYHLELDRTILASFSDAAFNVVFVEGVEPYLDFVSDLPASAFGWHASDSPALASDVRPMRGGAILTAHADADILLAQSPATVFAREPVDAHA